MRTRILAGVATLLVALGFTRSPLPAADGLDGLLRQADATAAREAVPADAARARRLPVPGAEARRSSAAKIDEIFGADAKNADSADEKSTLAGGLLQHATETSDATDCYVLLDAARTLSAEAGDVDTCFRAIAELALRYEVDREALQLAVLEPLAARSPPAAVPKVVAALLQVAGRQKADRDLEAAEKTAQLAATAARRGKDRELQKSVLEELADIRERKKAAAKAQPWIDRLAIDPSDREASFELGRFRCFMEDDWPAGLPLLARGSDDELARVAKGELGQPDSAAARVQLADAWWAFAAGHKGPDAAAAEARARMHYGVALGDLEGLDKARVQKRLETSVSGGRTVSKRPRNLVLCLDASAPGALRGPDGRVFDRTVTKEMKVAEWADVTGGRAVARQEQPARLPTVRPSVFGKQPGLVFDGNSLLVVRMSPPSSGTVVVVGRAKSTSAPMHFIGAADEKPGIRVSSRLKGEVNVQVVLNNTTTDVCESSPGVFSAAKTAVISGCWPSPFVVRLNGQPFPASSPAQKDAGAGPTIVIGAMHDGGAFPLVGDVAEVRIYDRVLSGAELAAVEAELAGKWGPNR